MLFHLIICTAFASSLDSYISYSDFITLSRENQIKTIKLVHEFLTEYEFQSMKSQLKKEKYYSYLKILDYFIASAHADEAQLFSQVDSEKKCYFAGWISFAKTVGKNKICVHPQTLNSKANLQALAKSLGLAQDSPEFLSSPEYQYFQDVYTKYRKLQSSNSGQYDISINENETKIEEKNKACKNSQSIMCNPQIYGQYGGKVLCVTGNKNYGVNSSLNCQLGVQELQKTNKDEFNQAMLDLINGSYTTNSSSLTQALETMYDTCLCGGDAGAAEQKFFQNSMAKLYAKNIFYSRTCASILSHSQLIKKIVLSCNKIKPENFPEDMINLLSKVNFSLSETSQLIKSNSFKQVDKLKTRQEVESLFQADKNEFQNIAQQNFVEAQKAGLCPVMKESVPKSLIATYNQSNKILKVSLEELDEFDPSVLSEIQIKGIQVQDKGIANFEKIEAPASAGHKQSYIDHVEFRVSPAGDLSQAQAYSTLDGSQIVSNIVDIPGVNNNDLILEYKEKVLTATIQTNETEFTLSNPEVKDAEEGVEVTAPTLIDAESSDKEKKYTITLAASAYKVSMSLTIGEDIITKEVEIPALGGSFTAKADDYLIQNEKIYHKLDLVVTAEEPISNKDLVKEKLSLKGENLGTIEEGDANYLLEVADTDRKVSFIYTDVKQYFSNDVNLTKPKASCYIKKVAGDDKTKYTLEAKLEPELEGAKLESVSFSKGTVAENSVELSNDEEVQDLSASATLKIGQLSYSLEKCVEKPEETLAACTVKVKQEELEGDSSKVKIMVSFLDKDEESLELENVRTYFYDQSQKPEEIEEEEEEEEETTGVYRAEKDNKDEKKEEEEEEKISKERKNLQEKYRSIAFTTEDGDDINYQVGTEDVYYGVVRNSEDRKFSVVVEGSGCDTSVEVVVKGQSSRAGNDNANLLQNNATNAVTPGGQVFGGQR